MSEFLLLGTLTGTGGITGLVEEILQTSAKDTGARVLYDSDPESLIERLIKVYRTEHFRRPSRFCESKAER
jgi:hypothetical protein